MSDADEWDCIQCEAPCSYRENNLCYYCDKKKKEEKAISDDCFCSYGPERCPAHWDNWFED